MFSRVVSFLPGVLFSFTAKYSTGKKLSFLAIFCVLISVSSIHANQPKCSQRFMATSDNFYFDYKWATTATEQRVQYPAWNKLVLVSYGIL